MEVKGKIETILPVESGVSKSDKKWSKQSLVINNGSEYNPLVCISFFGDDKIGMLKSYKVGQDVEVSINISSREYEGKYFHNIDGWKIECLSPQVTEETPDNLPF